MSDIRIVSWNVNGIRASMKKGFNEIYDSLNADLFCIQETKAQDDQVLEALADFDGYHILTNSAVKKGYSGTAIIAGEAPINESVDMGIEEHDQEGRITHYEHEHFNLVNVYVPNSGSGMKRLDYRATWDEAFCDYLIKLNKKKPVILTGDLNVAHTEIDLARPKQNYNKTSGYTQVEIDGLQRFLDNGFVDSFRHFYPGRKDIYTFWNQRFRARDTNAGWRIDYFLVAEALMPNVQSSEILDDIYGSDHCPIMLELNF